MGERKKGERKYVGKKELSTAVILVAEGYYDSKGPDRSSKLGRSPWWVAVPSFMQGRDQNGRVKKHPVRWKARRMNALLRRRIKEHLDCFDNCERLCENVQNHQVYFGPLTETYQAYVRGSSKPLFFSGRIWLGYSTILSIAFIFNIFLLPQLLQNRIQ